MKLSIVIICWNDAADLGTCLASVYRETSAFPFEVIVTDNGSTDGSPELVRAHFPRVRVLENRANLGFGGGNNRGFAAARGEHVLILNPDTVIRDRAIERMVGWLDAHPAAGALGCRVMNPDGSYQRSAYPIPGVRSYLLAALYLRWLGRVVPSLVSDIYPGWHGTEERAVGFCAGCCLLVRGALLRRLGGFDEKLFHQFEDADLCARVWQSGYEVRYTPAAEITHVGGRNRGRYPVPVVLETYRSRYRFFHKHHGPAGARRIRWVSLASLLLRLAGYGVLGCFRRDAALRSRLSGYRTLLRWHWRIDPVAFVADAREPDVGHPPLRPATPAAA